MSVTLHCPRGHEWQVDKSAVESGLTLPTCPTCGSPPKMSGSSLKPAPALAATLSEPPRPAATEPPLRKIVLHCPRGHEWTLFESDQGGNTLSTCPLCGAPPKPVAAIPPASMSTLSEKLLSPAAQPAPQVAGYDIFEAIGRDGSGVVYRARHKQLDQVVAIKTLAAGSAATAEDRARLRTEAEVLARLQHPSIVQIREVGEQNGQPYIALEFVDGGSLDRKLRESALLPRQAATIVEQLARGVQHVHQAGFLHRDLKPAHVLLTARGDPKLTGFFLAKQTSSTTVTGSVIGTPSYMAPEQAKGGEAGPATDVYGLGAIVYESLTGMPPFKGATPADTMRMVTLQDPVPPTQLNDKLPRDLETICLKCLAKEPGKRYAAAGALADDLKRYLAGEPIEARPQSWVSRLFRWGK